MKSEIKTLDLSEIIDIEKIIDREEINQLERQKHLLFNPRLYFDGDAGNVLEYLLIALKNTVSDSDFILDGVNKLGREMGLLFAPNPVEGNVCFAENNEEMRDEFKQVFTPADLRDFLYAVVFTSLYQNDGENSLPRIPLLTDSLDFWQLVRLGGNLRLVHLLECPAVEKEITIFKGKGDDEVKEVKYDEVVISPPPSRQDESTPPPEGNLVPAHSALDQKASRAGSPPLEGSGVVGKTQPPTTNSGYESKASRAGSPPLEGSGVVAKAPPLSDDSESGSKASGAGSPPLEGSGVVEKTSAQSDSKLHSDNIRLAHRRNTKNYFSLPYNKNLKEKAQALRQAGNLAEVLFWNQVKNKQFLGLDFDRQKIIGDYIVDFYCPNCGVVVEIDGRSHDNKEEYDIKRDAYLESLGLIIIHLSDKDVLHDANRVVEVLKDHEAFREFEEFLNSPPPSRQDESTPPPEGNLVPAHSALDQKASSAGSPPLEGSGVVGKTQPPTTNSGYESKASRAGSPPLEGSGVVDKAPPLSDGSESGSKSSSVDSPPLEGSGVVSYKSQGKIYINPTQFFNNISSSVWTLQMGKYAPAQEWLRSKEGKQLTSNDIRHYQRIIAAIAETQRLSKKIINITNE